MPLLAAGFLLLLAMVLLVLSLPFSIIQRYRLGTARRPVRGWVAALNFLSLALSAALLLGTAALAEAWVPGASAFSFFGLVAGGALGLLGLALTRWEATPKSLFYTPNRWLVLALTAGVALKLAFGFWRAWHVWHSGAGGQGWLAASGAAGSMAAGAVVLGYYLTFWAGVWGRARKRSAQRDGERR